MRQVDEAFLDAVAGTGERLLEVNLWRDGEVVAQGLDVSAGSMTFASDADMTRLTEGLRVVTDDLSLPPYSSSGGLAPYGQRLEVRAGVRVAGEPRLVRLGFVLIDDAEVDDVYWRDGAGFMQRSASLVPVDGVDLMQVIDDFGLLTPEQPPAGATCLGEIRRLVGMAVPWRGPQGVTDRAVPSTITYSTDAGSRLKAVQDLAAACDARCRVDDDGYFVVVPRAHSGQPQWRVHTAGAPDGRDGQVIRLRRRMSRRGVYNVVVARGQADGDAAPVQAIAYDEATPARYGGPFGTRTYTLASPLLTTQAAADAAARTRMDNLIAGRDVEVTAQIIPNPAIEIDDVGTLVTPFEEFTGVVRAIRYPLVAGGLMEMTLSIAAGEIATVDPRRVLEP